MLELLIQIWVWTIKKMGSTLMTPCRTEKVDFSKKKKQQKKQKQKQKQNHQKNKSTGRITKKTKKSKKKTKKNKTKSKLQKMQVLILFFLFFPWFWFSSLFFLFALVLFFFVFFNCLVKPYILCAVGLINLHPMVTMKKKGKQYDHLDLHMKLWSYPSNFRF